MFGFKDHVSMKDYGSPHHRVPEIKIPLLCLNAEDDPVCLGKHTTHKHTDTNQIIVYIVTDLVLL